MLESVVVKPTRLQLPSSMKEKATIFPERCSTLKAGFKYAKHRFFSGRDYILQYGDSNLGHPLSSFTLPV